MSTSSSKKAGSSTIKGPLIANGGANFSNDNFNIEMDTGNTKINGTLDLLNVLTVSDDVKIEGNFSISSGVFKVNKSGNTTIIGDLEVNGTTTLKQDFELRNTSGEIVNKLNVSENGFTYFLGSFIGMGTSKPSHRLDVEGNINVGLGYTYKMAGNDVVFSQWETINNEDISFNKGKVYLNFENPTTLSQNYDVNLEGILNITGGANGNGNIILNEKTIDLYILQDVIPRSKYASQWSNNPENATITDDTINNVEIESIYTQYDVQIANSMAIGTEIDKEYELTITGKGINLINNSALYFNGVKFINSMWKVYNKSNPPNIDSQYIYYSTAGDPTPAISYVGIGTSSPEYNLDVNGDINIKGNLLINGNGVIFPSANEEGQPTSDWTEGLKSGDNQTLYYNGGFVGIGTENPSSLLTLLAIDSTDGNALKLESQNGKSYLTISRTTTTMFDAARLGFTSNSDNHLELKNLLSQGTFSIENSGGGMLYMNSNGNIGIGTSSPSSKLDIIGNTLIDGNINIVNNGSKLIINNSTNSGSAESDNKERVAIQHSSNDLLEIDPGTDYKSGVKIAGAFCIVPGNNNKYNVGVGISAPIYQFDVDGDINFSGELRKNGLIQYLSQWETKYDGNIPYIIYPKASDLSTDDTQRSKIGIGISTTPQSCFELFDRKVSKDFYPQIMLTSSIDSYTTKDQGTTIELNTYSTELKKNYKGIRLHTLDESISSDNMDTASRASQVGFAIDTNNNNSTTEPFINIFRLSHNGNLGLGNFLDTSAPQDPSAKLHIMNPTTDQPALIITDNKNPSNPEFNVSDLNIICSKSQSNNLGYSSKIIGLNIKHAISDTNTLLQNSTNDTSKGACAINLSAGGANGGANPGPDSNKITDAKAQPSIWRNASALGVLFTDASTTAGSGKELKENFSISYNGNVGIRTWNSPSSNSNGDNLTSVDEIQYINSGPEYGIDLRHHISDTNAALRYTGSINITGNYFINGKLQHSPWSYLQSSTDANVKSYTTKYDANFAVSENNGNNDVYDTPNNNLTLTVHNNINQIDSCLGIGTTAPRGMCDIRGSLYAKYMIINSDKIDKGNGLSLMNARFENGSTSNNSKKQPSGNYSAEESVLLLQKYSTGDTSLNSVASGQIRLTNMGRELAGFDPNDGSYDNFQTRLYGNTSVDEDPNGRSRLHVNGSSSHIQCGGYIYGVGYIQTASYLWAQTYLQVGTNINAGGDITSGGRVYANSDIRLKTNIKPIENSLEKVNKLRGVTFNKKNNISKTDIGLIAQEVESVVPEVVTEDDSPEKIKSIAYANMTALLIESIKELTQKNEELQKRIEILENKSI